MFVCPGYFFRKKWFELILKNIPEEYVEIFSSLDTAGVDLQAWNVASGLAVVSSSTAEADNVPQEHSKTYSTHHSFMI